MHNMPKEEFIIGTPSEPEDQRTRRSMEMDKEGHKQRQHRHAVFLASHAYISSVTSICEYWVSRDFTNFTSSIPSLHLADAPFFLL